MLYRVVNGSPVPWTGERIDGIAHPLDIEHRLSDEDLSKMGLYREPPVPDPPPGKYVAS